MAKHLHIIEGEFQSDKYPTTPRGMVPLKIRDLTAQDLLWEYAQRRRAVDAEFASDLELALTEAGYDHAAHVAAVIGPIAALSERLERACIVGSVAEVVEARQALYDEVARQSRGG